VTGANNTEFGRLIISRLATGLRHDHLIAEQIERMLFRRLDDPSLPLQRAEVEMEFVWRESAGQRTGSSASIRLFDKASLFCLP